MFLLELRRIAVVIVGSFLLAISLNFFLINANVYASGFSGMAQLLASIFNDFLSFDVGTGIILFLLNVPVLILGWLKIGRGFTVYSIISVVLTTIFLEVLPILSVSEDIILNSVTGGVVGGIGVGISLKYGASTGGMDIIAMILSRMKDRPVGVYLFFLNAVIIIVAGILYAPENALYTMLTLYVTTVVIDRIHTRHEKLTVFIVTNQADKLQRAIHENLVRGITILPAKGAYFQDEKKMLYLVITRYELYDLEKIIKDIDPESFTNIVQTTGLIGYFRREGEEERALKKT